MSQADEKTDVENDYKDELDELTMNESIKQCVLNVCCFFRLFNRLEYAWLLLIGKIDQIIQRSTLKTVYNERKRIWR